ncbi:unnamed protein product, partial [Medioppia subpectinata]
MVCVATARDHHYGNQFDEFKAQYQRLYEGAGEESARRAIFTENYERIIAHNLEADAGQHTYRLAVNQFADWTNTEYRRSLLGYKHRQQPHNVSVYTGTGFAALPDTVDWRTKGVVTPVKNQKQCGSCWAFSAVASIEGQHALSTSKLVSLSEQNLVDCSRAEGNEGCEGGLMDDAFEYVIKNKGIDTEQSYPYRAIDEKCLFKPRSVGATVTGFKDIQSGSESALQSAVATVGPISVAIDASSFTFQMYSSGVYNDKSCGNKQEDLDHGVTAVGYGSALQSAVATVGPISVAIDASSFTFQMYSSGVYNDKSCGNKQEDLDHGVTAVGYGVFEGKPYWLVKNSWDTTWGQKGYIFMSRNQDNQCGIATDSSFPTGVK